MAGRIVHQRRLFIWLGKYLMLSVERHGPWPELEDLQQLANRKLGHEHTTAIKIIDDILGGEENLHPNLGTEYNAMLEDAAAAL